MNRREKIGFFYWIHRVIRHETSILTGIAVLILSIVLVFLPETAIAQLSCAFTQITSTTGGYSNSPSINADGTLIAFFSNSDIIPVETQTATLRYSSVLPPHPEHPEHLEPVSI